MKVLIRTFPPFSNANYGGILQAYALAQALESIGADAWVDQSRAGRRPTLTRRIKRALMHLYTRIRPNSRRAQAWLVQLLEAELGARQLEFAPSRIAGTRLLDSKDRAIPAAVAEFDAFVAGSDQIWRPAMVPVSSYLFDFLAEADPRPRLSYAASFGVGNTAEYTPELVAQTRDLARHLTAVSVRERSGISLAEELWGVAAAQHIDPTLLLPADHYREMAEGSAVIAPAGGLVDYVLDKDVAARESVEQVRALLGVESKSLIPTPPSTWSDFRSNPDEYMRPSVEEWLRAIHEASYVVTDSFHGTVFSIIFKRPFMSIVNRRRGAARFESLLQLFGMEDRLVEPGVTISPELVLTPINWDSVDAILALERDRSLSYLRDAIFAEQEKNL